MKLIVGLGNPGDEYKNNRHNVGFIFVDYLLQKSGETINEFKFDKYLRSEVIQTKLYTSGVILAKPQTFMNASGDAVRNLLKNWKLKIENLIVVHDDLDIPLGKFKIQIGTGPKLHNGLDSIDGVLKTGDYVRIRIGVDNRNPQQRIPGEAYVLQNFKDDEAKQLPELFDKIYERLKTIF